MKGTRIGTLAVVLVFTLAPLAYGTTFYVADTGTDGAGCGSTEFPCRSISQAIAIANPLGGDTIIVRPGRYGDLNQNGVLGELGEETGSPGCGCVLSMNKAVILISSAGAAVTVIDGRSVDVGTNVLLITDGGEFGRPGKGFTVTRTAQQAPSNPFAFTGEGIAIDSANVMVRGNQVVASVYNVVHATGILALNDAPIRIEGNQVTGWGLGILGGTGKTVSKNHVWSNFTGILASGGSVVGNVATDNITGIWMNGTVTVTGNAAYGNRDSGFTTQVFSGVFAKNNMFGNICGLENMGVTGLVATNNYWGAPTGPGSGGPADDVCNSSGGTTNVTPFATKPFTVKPLKP